MMAWWQWRKRRRYRQYIERGIRFTEAVLFYVANGFDKEFPW